MQEKVKLKRDFLLEIILMQIPNAENYLWKILWLDAVGEKTFEEKYLLELSEYINQQQSGYPITLEALKLLGSAWDDIIDIVIVGDETASNLKRYETDDEMFLNCRYTIMFFDSSFWEVVSKDITCVKKLKELGSVKTSPDEMSIG